MTDENHNSRDLFPREELEARYRRLQAKVREYRQEARRCRRIARLLAEARGTNAVLTGIYPDETVKGGILMFICAPNLCEANLGEAAQIILREFWNRGSGEERPDTPKISGVRVTGTESDK